MHAYMITLGDKIRAKRYDGQMKEIRKFYDLAIRYLPAEGASTGTMIALAIVYSLSHYRWICILWDMGVT